MAGDWSPCRFVSYAVCNTCSHYVLSPALAIASSSCCPHSAAVSYYFQNKHLLFSKQYYAVDPSNRGAVPSLKYKQNIYVILSKKFVPQRINLCTKGS